jgi:hypothetical protein
MAWLDWDAGRESLGGLSPRHGVAEESRAGSRLRTLDIVELSWPRSVSDNPLPFTPALSLGRGRTGDALGMASRLRIWLPERTDSLSLVSV